MFLINCVLNFFYMIEKSKKEKENDYCERLMKGSSSKNASFVENWKQKSIHSDNTVQQVNPRFGLIFLFYVSI